jgi:hypothetical protein
MGQWKKEKGNGVPMTRSYLYLFLSHSHAVLLKGTQRNRRKLSECSKPLEIILFPTVSAWSTKSEFSSDFRGLVASAGRTYLTPSWIYLTIQIYPVLIEFQRLGSHPRSDISNPKSDISDLPDLFEPRRVPVPCHHF